MAAPKTSVLTIMYTIDGSMYYSFVSTLSSSPFSLEVLVLTLTLIGRAAGKRVKITVHQSLLVEQFY